MIMEVRLLMRDFQSFFFGIKEDTITLRLHLAFQVKHSDGSIDKSKSKGDDPNDLLR